MVNCKCVLSIFFCKIPLGQNTIYKVNSYMGGLVMCFYMTTTKMLKYGLCGIWSVSLEK